MLSSPYYTFTCTVTHEVPCDLLLSSKLVHVCSFFFVFRLWSLFFGWMGPFSLCYSKFQHHHMMQITFTLLTARRCFPYMIFEEKFSGNQVLTRGRFSLSGHILVRTHPQHIQQVINSEMRSLLLILLFFVVAVAFVGNVWFINI
jgi:hypothetical protein